MKAAPEVRQCYTVSGEMDFIVIAHFEDMPAYDDWGADNFPLQPRHCENDDQRRLQTREIRHGDPGLGGAQSLPGFLNILTRGLDRGIGRTPMEC